MAIQLCSLITKLIYIKHFNVYILMVILNTLQGIECNRPSAEAIVNFMGYCDSVPNCGESQNLGYCNIYSGKCCCYNENSGE